MAGTKATEVKTETTEKESERDHPRQLERYTQQRPEKEVSQAGRMESQFREKTESKRVFCAPRVEGFEKSGTMSNQEVKDYLLKDFPEKHVNNITMETVRYSDKRIQEKGEVELAHWEKREVVQGTQVFNKEVVINRQNRDGSPDRERMKDSIAHEVGHQVHNVYLERPQQEEWQILSADRPREKCVSEYARTSAREDFAESYRYYVRNPEVLQRASSEKYAFIRDRVFDKREYVIEESEHQ